LESIKKTLTQDKKIIILDKLDILDIMSNIVYILSNNCLKSPLINQ